MVVDFWVAGRMYAHIVILHMRLFASFEPPGVLSLEFFFMMFQISRYFSICQARNSGYVPRQYFRLSGVDVVEQMENRALYTCTKHKLYSRHMRSIAKFV